ncbi:MAG: SRPBCC family protein [Anaerolineae bacterium]
MGIRIRVSIRCSDRPPQSIWRICEDPSGIDGMFDFSFADTDDGGTRLTVRAAYALPGSVLGQRINRLTIEQKNERDLQDGLLSLKALVEGERSPRTVTDQ